MDPAGVGCSCCRTCTSSEAPGCALCCSARIASGAPATVGGGMYH